MPGPTRVIYLDVDDEITSAAARVRGVEAARVALVIPPGSRVATSRINFRLLARDATTHGRRLAIVAPDAASRALAAAAGLEVYASVAEYEAAVVPPATVPLSGESDAGTVTAAAGGPTTAPRSAARRSRSGADATAAAAAATIAGTAASGSSPLAGAAPAEAAPSVPASTSASSPPVAPPIGTSPGTGPSAGLAPPDVPIPAPAAAPAPDLRPRSAAIGAASVGGAGRRVPRGPLIAAALGVVAVLLVVGGVAAYLLLPSATIVVRPRVEPVPPVEMTVTADPDASGVDASAGVVPAQTVTIPVTASGTYKATGQRVEEAKATGSVRFTNCDFLAAHQIKAGSRVATRSGVTFTTDEAVLLPAASLSGSPVNPKIDCSDRDVTVTATKAGPAGNVPAGSITGVPGNVNPLAIRVTNPAPTQGGARQTFPKVTRKDVDAAVADLTKQLQATFAAQLADPTNTPSGTTLFPDTAALADPTFDPDPASFVDQEIETFDLTAAASGTVTAVDEGPISDIAAARLRRSIDAQHALVSGSVEASVGDASVDGRLVRFAATATGQQVRRIDAAALQDEVLGLTPDEARTQLAPYGDVMVELTPDWATTIPTYPFRVAVRIEGAPDTEIDAGSPEASPS